MEKAKAKGRGGERGRKKGKKKEGKRKQNLKEARKKSKRRKAKAILNPQREVGVQGLIRRFVLFDIICFLSKLHHDLQPNGSVLLQIYETFLFSRFITSCGALIWL